jgi:hypothetical protein
MLPTESTAPLSAEHYWLHGRQVRETERASSSAYQTQLKVLHYSKRCLHSTASYSAVCYGMYALGLMAAHVLLNAVVR